MIAVSLVAVYIVSSLRNKTSIFQYALLNMHAIDG